MQPARQDLTIYQGDTYDFFFRVRERVWNAEIKEFQPGAYIDLTGWTGKSQIRATPDATAVLAEFAVTISDQVATPGGVLLVLTPVKTTALPTSGGVWDVQLTNVAGEIRTFIAGKVTVFPEVTRA